MSTESIAAEILEESQHHNTFLSRIVKLDGFGGRTTGDLLGFNERGSIGGLLFGSIDEEVRTVAGNDGHYSLKVDLGDRDAVAKGLACGGSAKVISQLVSDEVAAVLKAISSRKIVACASLWESGKLLFVKEFGEEFRVAGIVNLPQTTQSRIIDRLSQLLEKRATTTAIETVDDHDVVFEVYAPKSKGVVVGSSKLADAIVSQFQLIAVELKVVDALEETLESTRLLSTNDALIILSHDHSIGVPACEIALKVKGLYIGALGSRHTQQARREQLLASGFGSDDVDSIYGPIGLNLGSKTPAETAVAIAAEFLAHRSGRNPSSLRTSEGPING
ncbi:MAG: XdhC family protein [Actinomycetota bacterium]|nr:XdhC family protein [Actinomycetota bacterium]